MFDLFLVDPPWDYNQRSPWQETKFGGGVHSSYDTMDWDRLSGLKDSIRRIANRECTLLLWCVWPKMDVAIDLIRAWDFKFSTRAFTWSKIYKRKGTPFLGPGAGTASNDEVMVLAYRGKHPTPAVRLLDGVYKETIELDPFVYDAVFGVDNDPVVELPHPRWPPGTPNDPVSGKKRANMIIHSAKPEEFRRRIDVLWSAARKLEMFARVRVPGWTSVGFDLTGNDIYTDLAMLAKLCPVA